MKVSVIGILAGGFVDVVSSFLAGIPFTLYVRSRLEPSQRVGPHAAAAVSAATHASMPLYVTSLLIGLVCSALGGFVAASIAERHERLNGALSCWLCVTLGVAVMASGLAKDPLWQQMLLILASPVCAFLGGDLRRRQRLGV
jgi:hypothetical protein